MEEVWVYLIFWVLASSVKLRKGYFSLFLVWWLNVWSVVTSTSRWKFEAIDGKWKISIIWIIDEESVVN